MRIAMTLIVRDEADVIEQNLRLHRALGVDGFFVLDNGSTDGTAEVLKRWSDAGIAHVTTDAEATTDEIFREWQTRLARLAIDEIGADWLIHNDADEFWWPLEGNLRTVFERLERDVAGVLAPRFEFPPIAGSGTWPERMTVRERRATVRPKLAHRAVSDVRVGPGSHHVISESLGLEPTAGRPSMRGLRRRPEQPRLIAPALEFPLAIWHVPLRSLEQLRNRLEIGLRVAGSTGAPALADRISGVLENDGAATRWAEIALDEEAVRAGLQSGRLASETGLRELLEALAEVDPGKIEPGSALVPDRAAGEREVLRAEVAREAVAGLVHNDAQALAEARSLRESLAETRDSLRNTRGRAKERERKLREARVEVRRARRQARRAQRKLSRIKQDRWWRLRPRLPRRWRRG